jgi:UDP-GlcNAc3NAcA epimerase
MKETPMKVLTVVGARPQFVKASAISKVMRENYSDKLNEVIVHTGQHFDNDMSGVFFQDLEIAEPKYNLGISGGSHGRMTGQMLESIENCLMHEWPSKVLVYGDTNSTLAAALASAKLQIPLVHVESGLRSFNNKMPEEINRIVTDRLSQTLLCPSEQSVRNLAKDGIVDGVHMVGDVMFDVAKNYKGVANIKSRILERLNLRPQSYILVTCHRAENTDDQKRLSSIVEAVSRLAQNTTVVFPIHPRTKKQIACFDLMNKLNSVLLTPPLPFLDMIQLEQFAKVILTDSGGVQKEAYFYEVPCVTMRDETEWIETVASGWNNVVGADADGIVAACRAEKPKNAPPAAYGDGTAAKKCVELILK